MTFSSGTNNPLINGNLQGDSKYLTVGGIFFVIGLLIAVLIPYLVTPKITENLQLATAEVIDFAHDYDIEDGDTYAEIYSFETSSGEAFQGQGGIWSSSPAYKMHDKIEVYYNSENPQENFIKDDRNLFIMLAILYGIGAYFGLFGLIILLFFFKKVPGYLIDRYMGTAGALSYGVPAALTLPSILYFHSHAPNFFFAEKSSELPSDIFWLGLVFTVTGLITIVATVALLKALKGTTSNSVSISRGF